MNRHTTYIAKNSLYAVVASLEGMQFNWAEYVASRMYNELSSKRALGKVLALLCSNYVSKPIKYQLKQSIWKEQEIPKETSKGQGQKHRMLNTGCAKRGSLPI